MTDLMEQAIERLRSIPEAQQDPIAEFLLHELAEDDRWLASTQANEAAVRGLIEKVLADDVAGHCDPLDPTLEPESFPVPPPGRNPFRLG